MSGGYDGSIKIDTSVNTSGFNRSMQNIKNSATTALLGVMIGAIKVVAGLRGVFDILAKTVKNVLFGALLLFAVSARSIFSALRESMEEVINMKGGKTQEGFEKLKNSFTELKTALSVAFLPLVELVIPYIQMAVSWLIKLFNTVAMITGAFLGQKEVLQVVEGSVKNVKKGIDGVKKAALGALAAFDQINVLQPKTDAPEASAVPGTGIVGTEILPITNEVLKNVQAVKEGWQELKDKWAAAMAGWGMLWDWIKIKVAALMGYILIAWDWLKEKTAIVMGYILIAWDWLREKTAEVMGYILIGWGLLWDWITEKTAVAMGYILIIWGTITATIGEAWEWIKNIWATAPEWFAEKIEAIRSFFSTLWEGVVQRATETWDNIKNVWVTVSVWFSTTVIEPVKNFFSAMWEGIKQWASDAWDAIAGAWGAASAWFSENVSEPIKNFFAELWADISMLAANAWNEIAEVFSIIGEWLTTNVGEPVKEAFGSALDWVAEKWRTIFEGVRDFVKNIINGIIGMLNGMLMGMVEGINGLINAVNLIPPGLGIPNVTAPQIPMLAKGGVIPPNAKFAAILGDQKNGRNIEAPEGLIRQIVSEEIGKIQADVRISFAGSLAGLVRELKPYIDKENVRVGGSLVKSGVTI